MSPELFYNSILAPIAPVLLDTPKSRCLMLAIAGHESGWNTRLQIGGPARSFWQIEENGALADVMAHERAHLVLAEICDELCIPLTSNIIFEALAWNDTLAYTVARLTLLIDPMPLPAVGDAAGSYAYYLRNWRPGKVNAPSWAGIYAQSAACLA